MSTPTETRISIKKLDAKKQIVYGEVYVPYVPDSQGDFMTPEEIERVAHKFLKSGRVDCVDTEHNLVKNGSGVVESFVAREGDLDFTPGAWVLGVHIPEKEAWAKAESGDIGGFSMYGTGRRQQRIVEIEVPDDGVLFGKTAATSGNGSHEHLYALDFDAKGNFLGGETDASNGHTHLIKKGTVTEPGPDGHRHRFSFVDTLVKGCGPMTDEQKAWQKKRKLKKGDYPGHPFRGNQYVDGNGGGTSISDGNPMGAGGGGGDKHADLVRRLREAEGSKAPGMTVGDVMASKGNALGARRGKKDYVSTEGKLQLNRWSDFSENQAYVAQLSDGEQLFFLAQSKLKNGNWKGTVLDEGAGGRTRGKAKSGIFEPPSKGSYLKWFALEDNEVPVHLRKDDMTAEDMPEQEPEQREVRCKKCQTPKACGKAGRCLISYEEDADKEEEEAEEDDE